MNNGYYDSFHEVFYLRTLVEETRINKVNGAGRIDVEWNCERVPPTIDVSVQVTLSTRILQG
jgi:hypothetical protein